MVSIIIPLYNGEGVIDECIRSILKSSITYDYEILIIDDKSTDSSFDIAKKYIRGNIILLQNGKNLGFTKTIMRGVDNARGEIVVLLNMDTVVEDGWLEGLVRPLKMQEGIGITGSKILYMNGRDIQHAGGFVDEIALSHHIGRGEKDTGQYNDEKEVEYVCGASLACRKELFKRIGGLDSGYSPLYYEEIDVAHRFRMAGYKIMYIPSSRLRHHERYTSRYANRIRSSYYVTRNRLRYVFKNYPLIKITHKFVRYEIKYFFQSSPKKRVFLLMVYLYNLFRLPEIFLIRSKEKKQIDSIKGMLR